MEGGPQVGSRQDGERVRAVLPRLFGEIRQLFGEDALIRVAQELGGQVVHLPRRASPSHPLARRIGAGVLYWLVDQYGGSDLRIPFGLHGQWAARARLIDELIAEGLPAKEVAKRAGCSLRTPASCAQPRR